MYRNTYVDSREHNKKSTLCFLFFSSAEHTCALPFVKYHEGCYLKVNQKLTRDAAQAYCQTQQGSVLALVESAGQNSWLSDQVTTDSWIGYKFIGSYIPPGSSYTQLQYQNSMGEIVSCTATIVFPVWENALFLLLKKTCRYSLQVGPGSYENFRDSMSSSDATNTRFCAVMEGFDCVNPPTGSTSCPNRGRWYGRNVRRSTGSTPQNNNMCLSFFAGITRSAPQTRISCATMKEVSLRTRSEWKGVKNYQKRKDALWSCFQRWQTSKFQSSWPIVLLLLAWAL